MEFVIFKSPKITDHFITCIEFLLTADIDWNVNISGVDISAQSLQNFLEIVLAYTGNDVIYISFKEK